MIGKIAAVLTGTGLILGIISVAIPYWEYHDDFWGMKVHTGLWQFCVVGNERLISYGYYIAGCIDIDVFGLRPVPGSLKAVRALEILGIIFLGIAVGVGFLKLTVKKHLLALFNVAGGLAILAGTIMIAGTITYGAKATRDLDPQDVLHLHAGFALCVVAAGLAIIGGLLFFCDRKRQQPGGQMRRTINHGPLPYSVAYTAGGYPAGTPGAVIMAPPYDMNMPYAGPQYFVPPPAYTEHSFGEDVKSPP